MAEEDRAPEKSTNDPSKAAAAASAAASNNGDDTDEDGGLYTKPNAVCRPAATMSQLEAACFAPEVCFSQLMERNPRLPALDEVFLTHHQAATAVDAPKLARLRQDVCLALQANPLSKFVRMTLSLTCTLESMPSLLCCCYAGGAAALLVLLLRC